MSSKSVSRFEELDAGRALGDLSLEEVEEWEELAPLWKQLQVEAPETASVLMKRYESLQ